MLFYLLSTNFVNKMAARISIQKTKNNKK